jgi:hypothetical protein
VKNFDEMLKDIDEKKSEDPNNNCCGGPCACENRQYDSTLDDCVSCLESTMDALEDE